MTCSFKFDNEDRKNVTFHQYMRGHDVTITAPVNSFKIIKASIIYSEIIGNPETEEGLKNNQERVFENITIFANPRYGWSIVESNGKATPVITIDYISIHDSEPAPAVIYTDAFNRTATFTH